MVRYCISKQKKIQKDIFGCSIGMLNNIGSKIDTLLFLITIIADQNGLGIHMGLAID